MPQVGRRKFAYTARGKKAAKAYAKKLRGTLQKKKKRKRR